MKLFILMLCFWVHSLAMPPYEMVEPQSVIAIPDDGKAYLIILNNDRDTVEFEQITPIQQVAVFPSDSMDAANLCEQQEQPPLPWPPTAPEQPVDNPDDPVKKLRQFILSELVKMSENKTDYGYNFDELMYAMQDPSFA